LRIQTVLRTAAAAAAAIAAVVDGDAVLVVAGDDAAPAGGDSGDAAVAVGGGYDDDERKLDHDLTLQDDAGLGHLLFVGCKLHNADSLDVAGDLYQWLML